MKITLVPVAFFQRNRSLPVFEVTYHVAVVDAGGALDVIPDETVARTPCRYGASFTSGIFQLPSRIEGELSFGW